MGFFILKSSNPHLGHVIFKNPQTGMIMRDIRSGISFGWYDDNSTTTYIVRFIDIPPNVSFKKNSHDNFD